MMVFAQEDDLCFVGENACILRQELKEMDGEFHTAPALSRASVEVKVCILTLIQTVTVNSKRALTLPCASLIWVE